jgi:hypothetical protein
MTDRPALELRFSTTEEFEKEYKDNLSKGGVFIETDSQPPLRSKVDLNLYPPGRDEPVTLPCEVVHVVEAGQQIPGMQPGVALQILDFDEGLDQKLQGLLAEEEQIPEEMEAPPEEPAPEGAAGQTEEGSEDEEYEESEEDEESFQRTISSFKGLDQQNLFMSLRRLPRHEKIRLAKRGPKNIIGLLIQEGDKQIMRFVIQNPRLGIPEVLAILKSPQTSLEIIQAIGKNSGWMQSDEVKYQLVINPRTPLPLALNHLKGLNQKDLAKIAKSRHVKMQLKSSALKLLELRRSGQ